MDWGYFLWGIGFIVAGCLMYLWVRGEGPSSEKNNWNGMIIGDFIRYWAALIMAIIAGIILVIKSLPG